MRILTLYKAVKGFIHVQRHVLSLQLLFIILYDWMVDWSEECVFVCGLTFIVRQLALPENALSRHSTELITPYHVMRLQTDW